MKKSGRWLVLVAALALTVAACGGGDSAGTTATTSQTSTTASPITTTTAAATTTAASATTVAETTTAAGNGVRSIDATQATITVDGDGSDWAAIVGLDLTLNPIKGEDQIQPKAASVKVAYDSQFVYMLFTVQDDYNWDPAEHMSASAAVMWAIDQAAGTGMGSDADAKDSNDQYDSLGMVDIWHLEPTCDPGEPLGGAVSGASTSGADDACGYTDEFASDPKNREEDSGAGAENSLLGVMTHSNPVIDGDGVWTFELRRPLQTGDAQDAQFAAGGSALMGVAYWDPDNSPDGWDDPEHVNSAIDGWIQVNF